MTTFPKPPPAFEDRTARRRRVRRKERGVKERAKLRDRYRCRVPGCLKYPIEGAHVLAKGMGHSPSRDRIANVLAICRAHHRGSRGSLHSGDLVAELLTPAGTSGPVRFRLNGVDLGVTGEVRDAR